MHKQTGNECNTALRSDEAIEIVFSELRAAEKKHPGWPLDLIHSVGIITEEVGEAMQAAIECEYRQASREPLRKELAQVGAMAIRALIYL